MVKTTVLSSNYKEEINLSEKDSTCDICYDRGYYRIFNAYDLDQEILKHCECFLGQIFLDNQLQALNSTPN